MQTKSKNGKINDMTLRVVDRIQNRFRTQRYIAVSHCLQVLAIRARSIPCHQFNHVWGTQREQTHHTRIPSLSLPGVRGGKQIFEGTTLNITNYSCDTNVLQFSTIHGLLF